MLRLVQPDLLDKPLLVLAREVSASASALARAHDVLECINEKEREAMRQAMVKAASQLAYVTVIVTGLLTAGAERTTPDQAS